MTMAEQPISIERHPFTGKIINWARWSASRPPQGHCGSIEHRHVPERLTEATAVDRSAAGARTEIDFAEAENVEHAVCALDNAVDRQILIASFIKRLPDKIICGRFQIRYRDLDVRRFRVISDVEERYRVVCEVMAKNPGVKIVRQTLRIVRTYGQPTR